MNWKVAALYRFVSIADLPKLQAEIKMLCEAENICGTLLLAPEGINGTVGGPETAIDKLMTLLEQKLEISKGEVKFSTASDKPFRRLKVRLKKEIVTLRAPEADPTKQVGTYVDPADWDKLIAENPDMPVIDTRNKYETAVGMFDGALDPDTENFTDFPDFVEKHLDPKKQKKVAMYCTGGIRCEKASSYMLAHGFEEVYHLKGGILKYLETVPEDQSSWNGDCFVFDRRVAVKHGLEESPYTLCYGCRMPLSEADTQRAEFEKGVSCHHCADNLTEERIQMLRHRHHQFSQNDEY